MALGTQAFVSIADIRLRLRKLRPTLPTSEMRAPKSHGKGYDAGPGTSRLTSRERCITEMLLSARKERELSALEKSILQTMVEGDEVGDIAAPPPRSSSQTSLLAVPRISISSPRSTESRSSFESAARLSRGSSLQAPLQHRHQSTSSFYRHHNQSTLSLHQQQSQSALSLRQPQDQSILSLRQPQGQSSPSFYRHQNHSTSTLHKPSNRSSHCESFFSAVSSLDNEMCPVPVMTPVEETEGEILGVEKECVMTGEVRTITPEYRTSSDAASCRIALETDGAEVGGNVHAAHTPHKLHPTFADRNEIASRLSVKGLPNQSHTSRHRHCQSLRVPQTDREIKIAKVYHSLSLHSGRSQPNPFYDENPKSPTYVLPRSTSVPRNRTLSGPLADLFEDNDHAGQQKKGRKPVDATLVVMRQLSGQSSVYSRDEDGKASSENGRWPPRSSSLGAMLALKEEDNKSQFTVTMALDEELAREFETDGHLNYDGLSGNVGQLCDEGKEYELPAEVEEKSPSDEERGRRRHKRLPMGRELSGKLANGLIGAKKIAKRSSQIFKRS